jgi:lysophospholipase L1-like esterase
LVSALGLLGLAPTACGNEPTAAAGGAGSPFAGGSGGEPTASGGGATGGGATASPSAGAAAGSSAGQVGSAGGAGAGGQISGSAGSAGDAAAGAGGIATSWFGTWASAQQLTEEANEPPEPGLTGNTLRQIVRVSIGGQRLRLRFSNQYGTTPVTLDRVRCAVSISGSAIEPSTDSELRFAGATSVTIPAGQSVLSEAFDFALAPLSKLAVSIHFGATSDDITGHPGSRTTSFLQAGAAAGDPSLPSAVTTDHWYVLSGIDVMSGSGSVAILGDSLSDGRGSTTNGNDRWTDFLAQRLQSGATTASVGVLNVAIGGNSVVSGGIGPPATARFDSDVLEQSGVRWLIVLAGVNDIGEGTVPSVVENLIESYRQFIGKAHEAGLLVYGGTLLPFNGHSYYSADHESARQSVNTWIRTPGNFDAVIDFDAAVRNPAQLDTLLPAYDSGDHLHLTPVGYERLAEAVDLSLLSP